MLIAPDEILNIAKTLGYWGVGVVVFAEMGLFFCFFLPGDSLLFAAGLLAGKGYFDILVLLAIVVVMSVAGYIVGYLFGEKLGHWLEKRPDSWYFKKSHLELAHTFFHKHGGKAVVLARVVPIVRTFIPVVAGMGEMLYSRFLVFTVLGAVIWAGAFAGAGYYLGVKFPFLIEWLLPIAFLIVLLSILPGIIALVRQFFAKKTDS